MKTLLNILLISISLSSFGQINKSKTDTITLDFFKTGDFYWIKEQIKASPRQDSIDIEFRFKHLGYLPKGKEAELNDSSLTTKTISITQFSIIQDFVNKINSYKSNPGIICSTYSTYTINNKKVEDTSCKLKGYNEMKKELGI